MPYNNRLSELRGEMSQREFAAKIGLSQQNYGKYEQGKQKLNSDLIAKICTTFGCSAEWLLGLDGKRVLPADAIVPRVSEPAFAPLRGSIHAGSPMDEEALEGMIELPASIQRRHPNGFFLRVEGDCMNRVYSEASLILVDPDRQPSNGSIAAFEDENYRALMRRYYRGANTLILSPDSTNPEHEDIVLDSDTERTVNLIGTVVWFQAEKEMD